MAADSKREVMRGIFALGIILPAALCTFGVGKSHLRMKLYLYLLFAIPRRCMLVDRLFTPLRLVCMYPDSSEQ